jgi:glycosyltransferase involved in cell wall biosynthesis
MDKNAHDLGFGKDTNLSIPKDDVADPFVSIVIPASNEELTVAKFIEWCKEGLASARVSGEIVIVSSSTDSTSQIALNNGARVIDSPKRGLGRAYIDAIPYIRGELVIMGDADCTYDFRDINDFVLKYKSGCDFVMGSRYLGSIQKGAMPKLHQYFGTPFTTWILNRLYDSEFTDIHCGMRAISLKSLKQINLESESWEYASEMLIKVIKNRFIFDEVPVKFYKDINGRESHHVRSGFLSPFKAGLLNLKSMIINGIDLILLKPSKIVFTLSLISFIYISFYPINMFNQTLSLGTQVLLSQMTLISLQFYFLSLIASSPYLQNSASPFNKQNINKFIFLSIFILIIGISILIPAAIEIFTQENNFSLSIALLKIVILGLFIILVSLILFFNSMTLILVNRRHLK